MQKSFNINSSSGSYAISVEQDILQEISKSNKDSLYIIDEKLKGYIPKYLKKIIKLMTSHLPMEVISLWIIYLKVKYART